MPESITRRRVALIAMGAAVLGLLAGAGLLWGVQRGVIGTLRAENSRLTREIATLTTQVDSLTASAGQQPTSTAEPSPPEDTDDVPGPAEEGPSTEAVAGAREFAFIDSVTTGGSPTVVADYAQFLTGTEAEKAAAEAGDEPPPNDFYIANVDPRLRTLRVASGLTVRLVSRPDGTVDVGTYTVPLSTWAKHFASPTEMNSAIRTAPYWLTVESGVVTAIEEQYLP